MKIFDKPGELVRDGVVQPDTLGQVTLIRIRKMNDHKDLNINNHTSINGLTIEIPINCQPTKPGTDLFIVSNDSHHKSANGSANSTANGTATSVVSSDQTVNGPPDGGWGWVIMVASLILIFLTDGVAFSVGTLYPSIKEDFDADSAKASLVSSLINAFSLLLGPVASVMADFYGHRLVAVIGSFISLIAFVGASFSPDIDVAIITYGFLAGTGFALMYVSSVVVVGLYFDRRRALAVGVASSGSGIGIFVIAAATGALLKVMSWRSISQIEAALMVLGIISGLTLRPLPKDASEIEENAEKSKWKIFIDRLDIKLFKILPFDLICCVFILGTTGCMLPYMYLPDVAQQYGIDTKDAAFLLSITGITNTIARVLCGLVIYRFPVISSVLLLGGISIVGGIFTLCVPEMTTYPVLAIYAAVLGFVYAGDAALTPLMLVEILSYNRLNSSVGFMCMFRGVTILIAGPIGGYLQDVTNNYNATFYLSGCAFMLSALFCLLTWLAMKMAGKKEQLKADPDSGLGKESKQQNIQEGIINYGLDISEKTNQDKNEARVADNDSITQ